MSVTIATQPLMTGHCATNLEDDGHRFASPGPPIALRDGFETDATEIHALIAAHIAEGRLLPREQREIAIHAHRFVVASRNDQLVACAELAPLSRDVSEIRSLVVSRETRGVGVGCAIVGEFIERATTAGIDRVCAFTHAPSFFVRLGFSLVPHAWLPGKIDTDCRRCSQFRRCGQYAVVRSLGRKWQARATS